MTELYSPTEKRLQRRTNPKFMTSRTENLLFRIGMIYAPMIIITLMSLFTQNYNIQRTKEEIHPSLASSKYVQMVDGVCHVGRERDNGSLLLKKCFGEEIKD